MERKWRFTGRTVRDVFKLAYRAAVDCTDGDWEVVIRPLKSKRSQEQNRRYWAMLREIAATVWLDGKQYGDDAWHEYFRQTFIGRIDLPGGGFIGETTTRLSVGEFQDYMTRIEHWCAENGYPVMVEG